MALGVLLTREGLRAYLVEHGIAGAVDTPREENLRRYRLMSDRDPRHLLGLAAEGRWTPEDVLALMAQRCGVSPDPNYRQGPDTIDPDLTVDRLDATAARLGQAWQRRERVLLATGHPAALLGIYLGLGRALRQAGCELLTPAQGWRYQASSRYGPQQRKICYLEGVAMLSHRGDLSHTHSARPMRAMLAAMATGMPLPDLVIADHGWAGAAGQAGIDTVSFADSNDPALFVGEAEGRIAIVIPLDDDATLDLYRPITTYLLHHAGL